MADTTLTSSKYHLWLEPDVLMVKVVADVAPVIVTVNIAVEAANASVSASAVELPLLIAVLCLVIELGDNVPTVPALFATTDIVYPESEDTALKVKTTSAVPLMLDRAGVVIELLAFDDLPILIQPFCSYTDPEAVQVPLVKSNDDFEDVPQVSNDAKSSDKYTLDSSPLPEPAVTVKPDTVTVEVKDPYVAVTSTEVVPWDRVSGLNVHSIPVVIFFDDPSS